MFINMPVCHLYLINTWKSSFKICLSTCDKNILQKSTWLYTRQMFHIKWIVFHVLCMVSCYSAYKNHRRHENVIKWKHFRVTGPLCGEFTTGEFPTQRPMPRSFGVFFHLRLTERLSKQSWGWWYETPLRPSRRHSNGFALFLCFAVFWNPSILSISVRLMSLALSQSLYQCLRINPLGMGK